MARLSLYLNESEMNTLRIDAKREGLSLSGYVARLIRENAGNHRWPAGYWDRVYGSLQDDSFNISDDDLVAELDGSTGWFK